MKFISNRGREGQIQVQPEHMMTNQWLCPIPNPPVNTSERDELTSQWKVVWEKHCDYLTALAKCKQLAKPDYFRHEDDYFEHKITCSQVLSRGEKTNEWIHGTYTQLGWTTWKQKHTQPIDQCKSKSSTKMS